MRLTLVVGVLIVLTCVPAFGQLEPANSGVILYFPHLADGGTSTQAWQTVLRFSNYSSSLLGGRTASVRLWLYGNDGQPLALDFGNGPQSTLSFTIPPYGVQVFTSRMVSPTTVTGWAIASADQPVQGSLSFRAYSGGAPVVELAAHSIPASYCFDFTVTRNTGLALANPNRTPISLTLFLVDRNGSALSRDTIELGPLGHLAFNLWHRYPFLTHDFVGTLEVTTASGENVYAGPPAYFVAWAAGADVVMYSIPAAPSRWPPDHSERIRRIFLWLRSVATDASKRWPETFADLSDVELVVSSEPTINAWASISPPYRVTVTLALAQFFGDSDAELAAVIAHELGHVTHAKRGLKRDELGADSFGAILLLLAGFDPYGGVRQLGALHGASQDQGLLGQLLQQFRWIFGDPYASLPTRVSRVMETLHQFCGANPSFCAAYKRIFHPAFPQYMPLDANKVATR